MSLSDPLFATSPTIEINGQSYPLVQQNLFTLRMREALGGLSTLELSLVDTVEDGGTSHYAAGVGSPLELGAGIRVFAGAHEVGAPEIFDGQVTAVEAEIGFGEKALFTVLAEDRLFPTRRRRRSHLFENMALGDVVSDIARDHGLTPEVRQGVDTTARNWMQADETDLAFMRRILERFDCDMQAVGDKLQIGRVGMDQRALVALAPPSTLISARITADVAEQLTSVSVSSFDPQEGAAIDGVMGAGGFGPGTPGKSGTDVLREKFRDVEMHLGRLGPMTAADGDKLAEIEGQRRARGFVRLDGIARGDGNLRVGSWVELTGVNPQFANQYAVRETVHRFDLETGYRTQFVAECAYFGEPQ